jgi:hypothetical protein
MGSNCPKCNAPVSTNVDECPQCGILFNKWQQREENVASGNLSRYTIATATSSEFNWTILGIFCITLISIFYFLQASQ